MAHDSCTIAWLHQIIEAFAAVIFYEYLGIADRKYRTSLSNYSLTCPH